MLLDPSRSKHSTPWSSCWKHSANGSAALNSCNVPFLAKFIKATICTGVKASFGFAALPCVNGIPPESYKTGKFTRRSKSLKGTEVSNGGPCASNNRCNELGALQPSAHWSARGAGGHGFLTATYTLRSS
jgi:hypothetical protein